MSDVSQTGCFVNHYLMISNDRYYVCVPIDVQGLPGIHLTLHTGLKV